jgi:HK97 family phage portal protein
MNILGFELGRKAQTMSLDEFIQKLEAAFETSSGISITPDSAMQSPTVQAIVTAISRRMATLPVHVFRSTMVEGRTGKERMPDHPVERLLQRPNEWQTRVQFWLDATSWLVRYGNFYAFKGRGSTGPIRRLLPLQPSNVDPHQDEDWNVTFRVTMPGGVFRELPALQVVHARGPARNGLKGDSPIMDIREAIALELAAEKMGSGMFGNGAMPGIIFEYLAGTAGHRSDEERREFMSDFQTRYSGRGRFAGLLLPKGITVGKQLDVANDKAQFLETRRYQRTVIAGAFGVPPHLVGDLERGTFNNVEQQSLDFVMSVVLPYARIFEAAMERDLLTDEDRRGGIIIRFNIDGALRGDFKSRQEGLKIMREMGAINANQWREVENMNPISEEQGGEDYWQQGPSGQNADRTVERDDGAPDGTA